MSGAVGAGNTVGVLFELRDMLFKHSEIVHLCGYTHGAARLVGGMAVARLHDAWILVDEWYVIPIDTLGQLVRVQLVNAKFVMFGDHEGQFGPMRGRWDVPYSKVPSSALLKCMCRSVSIALTEYVRGPDRRLFKHYTILYQSSNL